jgi:hypothetical protein
MGDDLYFEGDPANDSARRHLERVLKEPERHPRWPWVVGALAAAAWYFWPRGRTGRTAASDSPKTRAEPQAGRGADKAARPARP